MWTALSLEGKRVDLACKLLHPCLIERIKVYLAPASRPVGCCGAGASLRARFLVQLPPRAQKKLIDEMKGQN
eukprot:COSAG06_NODE_99_length_24156_cov_20.889549_16_plen_72_part_00